MESTKQLLTHSSLKTFRQCKRKYQYQYEMGLETVKESEPLFFGKLMHNAIEEWCRTGLSAAIELVRKQISEAVEPDEYLAVTIIELMIGYDRQYITDPYEVIELEKEYRAPLLSPETARASRLFDLGGKLDAIYKDGNGRYLIIERKTTAESIEEGASYWQRLLIDPQISGYFLGAEVLGYKVESCLYDVIKKPTIRPYKATPMESRKFKADGTLYANQRAEDETPLEFAARLSADIQANPSKYYARKEIPRSENDLQDYLSDVQAEAGSLRECQKSNRWARNPESCVTVFGPCPYFGVCSGQASIDDPTLFKKKGTKHSELIEVA